VTITYAEALAAHEITVPPHLIDQAEIPAVAPDRPQAQGDLIILPCRPSAKLGDLVPAEGVQLVRSEASAHTHWLDAYTGTVYWAAATSRGADLGVVTVPAGSVAVITHTDEHGANRLDSYPDRSACYLIRRQRQMADEIRLVAD
jgi:hypothetical protein